MELQVKNRTVFGKKINALRREGWIPAELFGRGLPNLHLAVPGKEFGKVYRESGEHTVVSVRTEDGKVHPALITEVARNPLSQEVIAVDFHEIRMDEKIRAKVPLEFTGEAPAAKKGLTVLRVLGELELEGLPAHLPHRIAVDLSRLEDAGQTIHVGELKLPKEIKVFLSPDTVVATVSEKAKEEVVVATPTTAATTGAPPAEGTAPAEGATAAAPKENPKK